MSPFLQYNIGMTRAVDNNSALSFVIFDDFKKMCPWLENDVKNAGGSNNLIKYIDERCSQKESILPQVLRGIIDILKKIKSGDRGY